MTEEDKQNIKDQFNDIVSNGIVPILKAAGFKKKGNNFHAHVGEMDWCINIQKDRWGVDDYFNTWQFTVNIGVTFADYIQLPINNACDFPLESSCPFRVRIGKFIGKGDSWIVLRPNHDCLQTKELLRSTFKNKILPMLNNIKCPNDVWNYIENDVSRLKPLTKLFRLESDRKVFYASPIGLYVLCLATGKERKAESLRSKIELRGGSTEFLDKIREAYEKRRSHEADR